MIVRQRGDHADADKQHRQDHDGHRPMQDPRECCEPQVLRHRYTPFPRSGVWTALGSFFSPARRVKDSEYAADCALSKGSSDGSIPEGNTSGSKLTSRQLPSASPSMRLIVSIPISTCSRLLGHGMVASSAGSPG